MNDSLLSIAYVSAAENSMSAEELGSILRQSRANNVRNGLTGALLHHRGRFVQILEGPTGMVRARFALIAEDARHRSITVMSEKSIGERQFAEWTMGFRELTDSALSELDGFGPFAGSRTGLARLEHADNEAQQFLEWLGEFWLSPA